MSELVRMYEEEMSFDLEDDLNYLVDSFICIVAHCNTRVFC